jgi:flagellar hook-basal body complex protein FliE
MADSISLVASNLYNQVQNREIQRSEDIHDIQTNKASEFHKLVQSNFNSYSKLSPQEILSKINTAVRSGQSASNAVNLSLSSSVLSELSNARKALERQEKQAQKAAIGKANLVELMTATTQAENYLSVMVAMRDELKGAWDKIWGMQI